MFINIWHTVCRPIHQLSSGIMIVSVPLGLLGSTEYAKIEFRTNGGSGANDIACFFHYSSGTDAIRQRLSFLFSFVLYCQRSLLRKIMDIKIETKK